MKCRAVWKPIVGMSGLLLLIVAALVCGVRSAEGVCVVLAGMAIMTFGVLVILRKRMHAGDGF